MSTGSSSGARERYYIHKTRPFFVGGRIYYEVTFYRAVNKVSKFDRIIAFTDIDMTDKYSAMLTLAARLDRCARPDDADHDHPRLGGLDPPVRVRQLRTPPRHRTQGPDQLRGVPLPDATA